MDTDMSRMSPLGVLLLRLGDAAVNTVNPGTVSDTPATEVEQGRPGQSSPTQIADLVTFLISPISAVDGESIAIGHRLRGVINF